MVDENLIKHEILIKLFIDLTQNENSYTLTWNHMKEDSTANGRYQH